MELAVDECDAAADDDDAGASSPGPAFADAEDDDGGVEFAVTVAKDGAADRLVVECRSDGTYLAVLHAALEPSSPPAADADDDDDYAYTGPVFDELDDALQGGVEAFLAARGVDAALGAALAALAASKEQVEYVAWLARLREFVAA